MFEGGWKDAEEMNENQKKIFLGVLSLFALSVIWIPESQTFGTVTHFRGWDFIWNLYGDVAMKVLFIEWIAIGVVGGGLFYFFKDK